MLALLIILNTLAADGSALVDGEPELLAEGFRFSEGPLWLPSNELIFSDTVGNTIYRVDKTAFRTDSGGSNGLALDNEGRVICAEGGTGRITRIEADSSITVLADSYEGKRLNSPNDVVVRSDGIIFFTDPKSPRNKSKDIVGYPGVYALSPDKSLTLLTGELGYPNGLAFSTDEKTLYVADTTKAMVHALSLKGLKVTKIQEFCKVRIPDGIKVDDRGYLWAASAGGIAVYDAKGRPIETIRGMGMPTNCAFGGKDHDTLFVTARPRVFKIKLATR